MNRMSLIWLIVFSYIGIIIANAQNDEGIPTPPSPPYLAALPTRTNWTIGYSFPQKQEQRQNASAPRSGHAYLKIQQIEITRDSDLRRQIVTWADGSVSETWVSGIFLISTYPKKTGIYITRNVGFLDASVKNQFPNVQFPDFPELSWLSPETYTAVAEFQGSPCYMFMRNVSDQPMPDRPAETGKQMAWIDVRTHLPVALMSGDFLQTYSFGKGEPTSLALPPALSAALQEYKAKLPNP